MAEVKKGGGKSMVCMNEWEFAVKRLNHESQSRLLVTVAMMSRTSQRLRMTPTCTHHMGTQNSWIRE